jgi:hypothetical protein
VSVVRVIVSNMSSIFAAVDALERALEVLGAADWTQVADGERVGLLDRLETCARRQRAVSHAVIHGLDAAELGAPVAATAAAWAAGVLDPEHLRTIQKFMRELPDHVGPGVAEDSEALLAGLTARSGGGSADALSPAPPPDRQRQRRLLDQLSVGDRPAVLPQHPAAAEVKRVA